MAAARPRRDSGDASKRRSDITVIRTDSIRLARPSIRRAGLIALSLLAGCGGSAPDRNAQAGTDVVQDGVTYSVQSSRELDPFDPDDRAFLTGVPRARLVGMTARDVLVGVFIDVSNDDSRPHRAIARPELISAEGQVFMPMRLPKVDPFAYRGARLAPGAESPDVDAAPAEGPEGGSVLVYRVPEEAFVTDRPFTIQFGASGRSASVQLDL
jgi:hypothetical protein